MSQPTKEDLLNLVSSRGKGKREEPVEDEREEKMKEFTNREKERILNEKEEAEERLRINLAKKIRQYYDAFPFVTTCAPKQKLEKMNILQLEMEWQRIITNLNARSALETVQKIDYALNYVGEQILISNGIPAMGLADFTRSQEGLEMMAQEHREFAIEWQDWLGSCKEIRYLMKTVGKIALIVEINKKNVEASFTPEEERKFENL